MANNKTVLISLIGKGRALDGKKGYQWTSYYFKEIERSIDTFFLDLLCIEC